MSRRHFELPIVPGIFHAGKSLVFNPFFRVVDHVKNGLRFKPRLFFNIHFVSCWKGGVLLS